MWYVYDAYQNIFKLVLNTSSKKNSWYLLTIHIEWYLDWSKLMVQGSSGLAQYNGALDVACKVTSRNYIEDLNWQQRFMHNLLLYGGQVMAQLQNTCGAETK